MTKCPKCSSVDINDPVYSKGQIGCSDHLLYKCGQCGYQKKSPCHDAQQEIPNYSKLPPGISGMETE